MYTRVATICIEDSIVSKSSISYRFTTELGLETANNAMEKFLKELRSSPGLVNFSNSKTSAEFPNIIKRLEILVKNEELDRLETNDKTHFFCLSYGLPDSLEELEWFLNIQLGLGS